MDIKKLQEEINPIYETAKGCLKVLAGVGNKEAMELLGKLNFPSLGEGLKALPEEYRRPIMKYIAAVSSTSEARFMATSEYLLRSGVKNVLDVPCGYTNRGLSFSKKGIQYYGADLPAVIDDIEPAALSLAGEEEKKYLHYATADVTNYESLRRVVEGVEGELAITTEGLFMYLSDSEIFEFLDNLHRLLTEFGGFFMTIDREMGDLGNRIAEVAMKGESMNAETAYMLTAGKSSNNELDHNFFYKETPDRALEILASRGFHLEKVQVGDCLPSLGALKNMPEEDREAIMELYRCASFWVATAKKMEKSFQKQISEESFDVEMSVEGESLKACLRGRLDTLTSPSFLGLYREAAKDHKLTKITIDLRDLAYISSAGLRTFMIMYKSLPEGKNFYLENISPEIREILETTGFATFFLEEEE